MSAADRQDLRAFLERYPWPDAMRAGRRPLEWLWTFDLEAPLDALWRQLIDTSRFNRALGMGRMDFTEIDGVLHGATVNGGFRQEWVEVPWSWVSGRTMTSVRRYSRGFARLVRAIFDLEEIREGHVRLRVYFGWIPRGPFGWLMLALGERVLKSSYTGVITDLARQAQEKRPPIYRLPPPTLDDNAEAKLQRTCEALRARDLPEEAIARLAEHIKTADELDLYRLQVRALARAWGIDARALVRVCLHATRLGLLEMSWDVVCPHCRGVREELDLLSEVPASSSCEVCEVDFGTGDPSSVEITFHVHPSVRQVPRQYFCSAEPATKAHIKVQVELAPGESRELAPRLPAGRYRLRLRGAREVHLIDVDAEATAAELRWSAPGEPSPALVGPDPTLHFAHSSDAPQTFILEEARWVDDALRPTHLLGTRDFRDLFSEHFVGVDVQLAIGEQVILFTDMVGSTHFYAERGDAAAFIQIRDHFSELATIYDEAGGVLIKTIGDATMAAFAEPVAALRAAQAIQRRFHGSREESAIRLRISLHAGPCIAVNLNSLIDYFGGTVNAAAKLQACADSGQIAMSPAIVAAPGVRDFLAAEGAQLTDVPFTSAAFAEPIVVTRWDVWG